MLKAVLISSISERASAPRGDQRHAHSLSVALFICATMGAQLTLAQTSAGGVSFYPAPPDGFSAVLASDGELMQYGFPARPPVGSVAYSTWARRMANAKMRVATQAV